MDGRAMRALSSGYEPDVDRVSEQQWNQLVMEFDDCNLNQTWAYGAARQGRWQRSHLLLRLYGDVVALAEARVMCVPFLRRGLAYVSWGPIWQRRGARPDVEHFRQAVRALRNEFVCKRGLVLRLFPLAFDDDPFQLHSVLKEEGFETTERDSGDRTLLLDLTSSLEEIQAGLEGNWRRWPRWQRRDEMKELELVEGADSHFFEELMGLYGEMAERKDFTASSIVLYLQQIQQRLPAPMKLRGLLCKAQGQACAGIIASTFGTIGIELVAASNEVAKRNHASYLLRWKLLEIFKKEGCTLYNLNGINPEKNPGTYAFKRGLAGKSGRDIFYLGKFDAYPGLCIGWLTRRAAEARRFMPGLKARFSALRSSKRNAA